jgi:hypothetical protein
MSNESGHLLSEAYQEQSPSPDRDGVQLMKRQQVFSHAVGTRCELNNILSQGTSETIREALHTAKLA